MLKTIARSITPPLIWEALSNLKSALANPAPSTPPAAPEPPTPKYGHHGDFASFEDALRECADTPDYEAREILDLTLRNTKAIKHDPHLPALNIRLLAAVQHALARLPANARVLDYGGALGAHYFCLRGFLPPVSSWTVVELPATVKAGKELEDGVLRFSENLEPADLVIASGVLLLVPKPYEKLAELCNLAPYVLLDKCALWERDRLTVHRVHPSLFTAAYPAWLLSSERFSASLPEVVMSWDLPGYPFDIDGQWHELFKGFLLKTRQ